MFSFLNGEPRIHLWTTKVKIWRAREWRAWMFLLAHVRKTLMHTLLTRHLLTLLHLAFNKSVLLVSHHLAPLRNVCSGLYYAYVSIALGQIASFFRAWFLLHRWVYVGQHMLLLSTFEKCICKEYRNCFVSVRACICICLSLLQFRTGNR